jgi:hypothetical protein
VHIRLTRSLALSLVAAGVLAVGSYAFTASNTVGSSSAGQGNGTVSGYAATNVAYALDATTPTNLNSVSFTLNPVAATAVKVQLSAGGAWYSCTNTAGAVSCATTSPQATASGTTQLTVVAAT